MARPASPTWRPAVAYCAALLVVLALSMPGSRPAAAADGLRFVQPTAYDLRGVTDVAVAAPAGTTAVRFSIDGIAFAELTDQYAKGTGLPPTWRTATDAAWFPSGAHVLRAEADTPNGHVSATLSVVTHRTDATSLDGGWAFASAAQLPGGALDGDSPPAVRPGFDDPALTTVLVPDSFGAVRARWNDDDGLVGVYRRTVEAPPGQDGRQTTLVFDSCYWTCRMFVNGTQVGTTTGGYLPARFDVTGHLHAGTNTIAVLVDNRATEEFAVNPQLYWNWGGIFGDVHLETSPRVALTGFTAQGAGNGTLTLRPSGINASGRAQNVEAVVSVHGPDGRVALPARRVTTTLPSGAPQVDGAPIVLHVAEPRLWDLDHPQLYTIDLQPLQGAGRALSEKTGFRDVATRGLDVLLNGKPVENLHGFNRHTDYPGLGRAQPDGLAYRELKQLRDKGFRIFRPAHYPTTPGELAAADRLGLLVIEEVNVTQRFDPAVLSSAKMVAFGDAQLDGMIHRDRGHPSVIAWSVGNENGTDSVQGAQYVRQTIAHGKALDGSRLFTHVTAWHTADKGYAYDDLVSVNDYDGWYYGAIGDVAATLDSIAAMDGGKPMVLSEYGADAVKGHPGYGKGTEYYQALLIDGYNQLLDHRPHLLGQMYWTSSEFMLNPAGSSPVPVPGFHTKGLQTYWREPKLGWRVMFAPIRIRPLPALQLDSPDATDLHLPVTIDDTGHHGASGRVTVTPPDGFTIVGGDTPFTVPADGSTTVDLTLRGHLDGPAATRPGLVRATIDGETEAQPRTFQVLAAPPTAPWRTFDSTGTAPRARFMQSGDRLGILAAGADTWQGDHADEYGTVYRPGAFADHGQATVRVDQQEPVDAFAKAGLMIRNDLTAAGSSPGYVELDLTPGNGVSFGWDGDGDGYIDHTVKSGSGTARAPVRLRLTRDGSSFTAAYSTDAVTWTRLGTATVPKVAARQDVGVFDCARAAGTPGLAEFSAFSVATAVATH
ncbi:glycoside hydrolase family 2 TIM barrel-domain containing protein [Actinomadura gamaensis]|uniref:Glycoside hydrolase family 2 TIM barrel-domain containing protein n=1 Tax=Actinomadura gamaensis TaxID=1763541 RepID=A0ABV9TYW1_9ACTN